MDTVISIILPNYNGKELLEENLPILLRHIATLAGTQVIVVDDGSTDQSAAMLRAKFPQVELIALAQNRGFASACNEGARKAQGRIIYLMNTDIKVSAGFLEPLLAHFSAKDTFAVSSLEFRSKDIPPVDPDSVVIPLVRFKYGIFWYWYDTVACHSGQAIEQFCVSGGHAAFDKEKFLALGGFDTLFSPFYAEDGDICWRAWQKGWRSLLEPASRVQHDCKGTIGKHYRQSAILAIHWKNRFLLTWKNILTGRYLLAHLFFLPLELLITPLCGKKEFTLGFMRACAQLPELMRSKKRDTVVNPAYTNAQLFARFGKKAYRP